jgi:hypothetical protein
VITGLMLDTGCSMLDNLDIIRNAIHKHREPVEDPGRIITGEASIEDQPMIPRLSVETASLYWRI